MASVISMPRLSDTMSEGVLVKWLKQEGDAVEPGDIIAEVETDKAVQECEAFEEGTLLKLLGKEGDTIPIGDAIAILGEPDEDISDVLQKLDSKSSQKKQTEKKESKEETSQKKETPKKETKQKKESEQKNGTTSPAPTKSSQQKSREKGERILASPVARKIARESDLALENIDGSGPNGRIIKRDVEAALQEKPTEKSLPSTKIPATWEDNGESKALSPMRRTIARRLVEAKSTVPHFYLTLEADMDEAMKFRKLVHNPQEGEPVSFNDLVIKACALALKKVPEAHAGWEGESIRFFDRADISVAVATDEGLITPIIRGADQKSLGTIAKEIRELAGRARQKRLKPEEFTGGTFSVSNLGMYGIEEFSAIINPPEAAILAVGTIEKKPVVKDDTLTIGNRMKLTLSCDHRVIDGALGAKLLTEIKNILEKPIRLAL